MDSSNKDVFSIWGATAGMVGSYSYMAYAIVLVAVFVLLYVIYGKERLENINYTGGGGAVRAGNYTLTQPGQIGDSGFGDFVPQNVVKNLDYPKNKDFYSNLYDGGNVYHIQTSDSQTFTEDDLQNLLLERSRFSPALQAQQL